MNSNVRFRNHISIVVEKLGVFVGVAVLFLFTNGDAISDLMAMGFSAETLMPMLVGGGALLAMIVLVVGYNLVIWSRTWISLSDGSIVVERNTLHQKKNTIGIKNISNVNTEQNLFEMLIGTCKVKLDTNSLSTSDSTDVKIVLKKADAEAFRAQVMALMHQIKGEEAAPVDMLADEEVWDYQATRKEIVHHGLFSIRLYTIFVALASVAALGVSVSVAARGGISPSEISNLLVNVVVFGGLAVSAIRSLVMGFIRYYDFKIARRADKLVIRYGLLKKVHYTIPVSKINGIKLHQSPIARLLGYASAEVINIGMGDDDAEAEAFLCPYCSMDATMAHIGKFLPELAPMLDTDYDRQPKGVWFVWLWTVLIYGIVAAAVAIAGEWAIAGWQMGVLTIDTYIVPLDAGLRSLLGVILWGVVSLGMVLVLVRRVLRYLTAGSKLGPDYMLLVEGCTSRTYCWLAYRKVQYITLKQSPAAAMAKLQKGSVNILAATRNQVQRLPFMPQTTGDYLKAKIMQR